MRGTTGNDALPPGRAIRPRPSHRPLVDQPDPGLSRPASDAPPVDAVIVPAGRRAGHLTSAGEVAAGLGVPLVVLASRLCVPADVAAAVGRVALVVIDATAASNSFAGLRTLRFQRLSMPASVASERSRFAEVGGKRNLGLLLSQRMRWQSVLFLDDDVRGLTADMVWQAGEELVANPRLCAAGWELRDFDDNSVVCHARRETGLEQDVFVGAGALLVRMGPTVSFFPPVYNEDWLFLADWLAERRVLRAGEVNQLPYHPFVEERADREEFGDVLGEGLFDLLHEERSLHLAYSLDYWRRVIDGRRLVLDSIFERLRRPGGAADFGVRSIAGIWGAIEMSGQRLSEIRPQQLVDFVAAWRRDQIVWRARLAAIRAEPPAPSVADALRQLGVRNALISLPAPAESPAPSPP